MEHFRDGVEIVFLIAIYAASEDLSCLLLRGCVQLSCSSWNGWMLDRQAVEGARPQVAPSVVCWWPELF